VLSTIFAELKGVVDKRFLLCSFFPVLVTAFGIDLLATANNGGITRQAETWSSYPGLLQALIIGGGLAAILVLAAVLSSGSLLITQLYEGYFGPKLLKDWWVESQTRQKSKSTGNTELRFPVTTLQPTALGNVLRAAEDYPQRTYGLTTVVVWPRLFLVLPPDLLQSMQGPADTIQFLLNVSLIASSFAVLGGIYAAIEALGALTYLGLTVGGLVVARLAYLGAVEAAIDYGLHIRGAFDLHRADLLSALHRALPTTSDEELRLWNDVSTRLQIGEPMPVRYVTPPAK